MIDINIDVSDLLKWSRYLETIPKKTPTAIARALNTVGDNVVRRIADYVSTGTGLHPDDVASLMTVKRASPSDLTWSIDASQLAPPSLDWSRPWDKPADQEQTFDSSILVKIVTAGDEKVCPVCERLAEQSPYTLPEAQQLLPVHENCRCLLTSWQATRKLPVTFGQNGAMPPELLSTKELGDAIGMELKAVLRAVEE